MGHDPSAAEAVVRELFLTPQGRRDPYRRYEQLRELDPIHWSPTLDAWFVSRYADVAALLRDPRFGKNYPGEMQTRFGADWREHPSLALSENSMLNLDGPAHTRLRRLAIKAFTRRTVDQLRPSIEDIVDDLLDPFADDGGGDLLDALAFPMPVTVIGELLGVPEEDRPPFRGWVRDLVAVFEMMPTPEQIAAADTAALEIRGYFGALIQEKRRRPDGALLSRLAQLEDQGDRLTDDELTTLASLLFGAGFETTTNLIGNGVLGLLRQPEQLAMLRERPDLLPLLPDELLRFDGTAQMVVRYTHDDVEISGAKIPAGDLVFAMLGAANHDTAEFADPHRIDVTRGRFRPMSLGGGTHFCLGASLARAEIEIVVRSLLERFDGIELTGEPPRFRDRLVLRGLEKLELSVVPAERRRHLRTPVADDTVVPLPTAAPPAAAASSPDDEVGSGEAMAQVVRPAPGSEADRRWRNALREQVETQDPSWVHTAVDSAATLVLLARADFFRSCDAQEIAELAATAYPMSFEPGEQLCEEGAESLECYVIAEGEAAVAIAGRHVRRVGENDVVGERGPLEGNRRSATVTALSPVVTYAISRRRLRDLAERSPAAREGMFAHMRERYPD